MPSVKDELQSELSFLLFTLHTEKDFCRLAQATVHPVLGCRGSLGTLEPEGASGIRRSMECGEKLQNYRHDLYTLELLWGERRYSCREKKLLGTKYTKLLKVLFIDELHVLVYVLFRWCSNGRAVSMTLTPLEFLMCSAQYSTVSFFATDTNVLNCVQEINTKRNWLPSLVRNKVWKKLLGTYLLTVLRVLPLSNFLPLEPQSSENNIHLNTRLYMGVLM